jgi:hypothetical protein
MLARREVAIEMTGLASRTTAFESRLPLLVSRSPTAMQPWDFARRCLPGRVRRACRVQAGRYDAEPVPPPRREPRS